MSFFERIETAPEDPIYGLQKLFKEDSRENKINLSIGVLADSFGSLFSFHCMKEAKKAVCEAGYSGAYLPIDGLATFNKAISQLVFGSCKKDEGFSCYTAQAVGGSSALFIGGKFLCEQVSKNIVLPQPTWLNHKKIFEAAGFLVSYYPWKIKNDGSLDIDSVIEGLQQQEKNSIILFQASCHNPTGIDPTEEDWEKVAKCCKANNLFAFFDLAYLGLGRGLVEDGCAIRAFCEQDLEFFIAFSCSKNFGLYCERVGALLCRTTSKNEASVASQIRRTIRSVYSSPPAFGAHLVATILTSDSLYHEWEKELVHVRKRLTKNREALANLLGEKSKVAKMFRKSVGLFCLTGLTKAEVEQLRVKKAIYLVEDGRINVAALKEDHIPIIAKAIV